MLEVPVHLFISYSDRALPCLKRPWTMMRGDVEKHTGLANNHMGLYSTLSLPDWKQTFGESAAASAASLNWP